MRGPACTYMAEANGCACTGGPTQRSASGSATTACSRRSSTVCTRFPWPPFMALRESEWVEIHTVSPYLYCDAQWLHGSL